VLVIKRIHVTYSLRVDEDVDRDSVERAFERHMPFCPVYRSIGGSIDVTTELQLLEA
jgi:uncharacterized OsmC-like protein